MNKLVQFRLLKHLEYHRQLSKIKSLDTSFAPPKIGFKLIKAWKEKDYSCPSGISQKRWEASLHKFWILNLNERIPYKEVQFEEGKFRDYVKGESRYALTVWGIVCHLRNEGIIPKRIALLIPSREDRKIEHPPSHHKIEGKHMDKVLPHFEYYFDMISRKWKYIEKNIGKGVAYSQLAQALIIANYYYETLNADFAAFEESALKDIEMSFFLPYGLDVNESERWIHTITKDIEIRRYLVNHFNDIKRNYKLNAEITNKFMEIINGGSLKKLKFFDNEGFHVRVPTSDFFSYKEYYARNPWGYFFSSFLNVLDFGPVDYRRHVSLEPIFYRK